jgi:hypothetical protein
LPYHLATAAQNGIQWSRQLLADYPKHVAAVLASALLGAGGATYALAALAPDPADLTVQEVLEVVQRTEQRTDLASNGPAFTLFRSDITRSTDTADSLLRRLGVDDTAAANFLRSDPVARLLLGRSGRSINAETTEQNTLRKLTARWSPDDDGQFKRQFKSLFKNTGFLPQGEESVADVFFTLHADLSLAVIAKLSQL